MSCADLRVFGRFSDRGRPRYRLADRYRTLDPPASSCSFPRCPVLYRARRTLDVSRGSRCAAVSGVSGRGLYAAVVDKRRRLGGHGSVAAPPRNRRECRNGNPGGAADCRADATARGHVQRSFLRGVSVGSVAVLPGSARAPLGAAVHHGAMGQLSFRLCLRIRADRRLCRCRSIGGTLGRRAPDGGGRKIAPRLEVAGCYGSGDAREIVGMGHVPHRAGACEQEQQRWIGEWKGVPVNWAAVRAAFSTGGSRSALFLVLAAALVAAAIALLRRQWAAAMILLGASYAPFQHVRMESIYGCVVVVIAGPILSS